MHRVLFIANLAIGATAHHRLNDFLFSNRYIVLTLNTEPYFPQWRHSLSTPFLKLGFGPPFNLLRSRLKKLCNAYRPNIIWIEKNLYIPGDLMLHLQRNYNCKFVHFMHDDFTVPGNSNLIFKRSLSMFDIIYTTKKQNMSDYSRYIAHNKLVLVDNCISQECLDNATPFNFENKKWDICFIGRHESFREKFFSKLLLQTNYKLLIAGPGWKNSRLLYSSPYLTIFDSLWGRSYSIALAQCSIAVNLFTRMTKDSQTSRLLEIPTYGSVLISEFSIDFQKFYPEFSDITSFKSFESFLSNIKFLLNNPSLLKKIHRSQINSIKSNNLIWRKKLVDPLSSLLDLSTS